MTSKRLQVGEVGEKAARNYLEQLGYRIIETNYRCKLGEIDIIARDLDTIVIVEVRTKTGKAFGSPEESITGAKAQKLHRLALFYLQSVYRREVSSRIDLVAVMLDKDSHAVRSINHIRGILSA